MFISSDTYTLASQSWGFRVKGILFTYVAKGIFSARACGKNAVLRDMESLKLFGNMMSLPLTILSWPKCMACVASTRSRACWNMVSSAKAPRQMLKVGSDTAMSARHSSLASWQKLWMWSARVPSRSWIAYWTLLLVSKGDANMLRRLGLICTRSWWSWCSSPLFIM